MGSLPNLELLRVAMNDILSLPDSFTGLNKLAWLSLASNPACAAAPPVRCAAKPRNLRSGVRER